MFGCFANHLADDRFGIIGEKMLQGSACGTSVARNSESISTGSVNSYESTRSWNGENKKRTQS